MEKLSNIQEFYVTNRDFETLLWMSGLSKSDILNLPKNAVVLDIGGGLDQNFSTGVKSLRPDILNITIDPTLALSGPDRDLFNMYFGRDPYDRTKISYVQYLNKVKKFKQKKTKEVDSQEITNKKVFNQKRSERARETGHAIATLVPEISLKDSSVDLIVDIFGPGLYLQRNSEDEIKVYLKELNRVLKSGGQARIFPAVDVWGTIDADEIDFDKTQKFYEYLCKLLHLDFEIDFELIEDRITNEEAYVLLLNKK